MSMLITLIFVLTVAYFFHRRLIPKPIPGIPYAVTSRFSPWGDSPSLAIHALRGGSVFAWLASQCTTVHQSPVVQLFLPSFSTSHSVVVVADVVEVKDILIRRTRELDRAPLMGSWFDLLVPDATIGKLSDNGDFLSTRRLWNGIVSTRFLEEVTAPAVWDAGVKLMELWMKKADIAADGTFEAVEDLRRAALDAIWKNLFGSGLGLQQGSLDSLHKLKSHGQCSMVDTSTVQSSYYPHFYRDLAWLLTGLDWVTQGFSLRFYTWLLNNHPHFRTAKRRTKALLGTIVSNAEKQHGYRGSIARCGLAEVLNRSNVCPQPNEQLVDELLLLLITGHETTASATAWALKYMADNAEVQTKLHRALCEVFPTGKYGCYPSPEEISKAKVPWLDATIAEVLRISAVGPISFRQATRDCEILGHAIPAGAPIFLMTASAPGEGRLLGPDTFISRDPGTNRVGSSGRQPYHKAAPLEEFDPERWIDCDGSFNPTAVEMQPFSAGLRGCFGRRIALLEMRLLLVLISLSYELMPVSGRGGSYAAQSGLTRKPTYCYIKPVRRRI